jgi:flagellar FliL protein
MTLMAEAPNPPAEGAPPAEAPKSKKSVFLIIGIVVAVLAAGGGAAAFFMGGHASETASADDAKNGKGEKGAKKKAQHKEPAQYVKLEPPFVVNFEAKGLMRFLQVAVEVMTRDPVTAELIKKNDPMIRNDLIMLLGSQPYEKISSREGKEQLRAEALRVVATIIASEGGDASNVEQLYFTSFVMQ